MAMTPKERTIASEAINVAMTSLGSILIRAASDATKLGEPVRAETFEAAAELAFSMAQMDPAGAVA